MRTVRLTPDLCCHYPALFPQPQPDEHPVGLAGTAFLALWNDIADARVPEYDQWHTLEHVPERVAVTGFHGARRYVNREHAYHRYFTLYDVATMDAFANAEYKDLLVNPTPWSASMRPDFSNFLRAICAVTVSRGTGIGGAIGCLCVPAWVQDAALGEALDEAAGMPRITAIHCGRRSEPALTVPFKAPPQQTAPAIDFDRVALIEGLDGDACAAAMSPLRNELGLEALANNCTSGVFDLAFVFPGSEATERLAHRRAGWPRSA
jgi:hypothetical protein